MRTRNVVLVAIGSYFVGVYSAKELLKRMAVANIIAAFEQTEEEFTEEELVIGKRVVKIVTTALRRS